MSGAQELVLDASLVVAIPVAALAGLLSFFTPCTLPLVPGYLSYVAGVAGVDGSTTPRAGAMPGSGSGPGPAPGPVPGALPARRRTVVGAALFVLGFAVVFTSYGALFGGLGGRLVEHQELIIRVGGLITIVLGVLFTGVAGRIPLLQRTFVPRYRPRVGLAGAPVLGAVFGIGWTPCVGPALAAVLTLATTTATAGRGATLTLAYALGLGLPFVLAALFLTRALELFASLRRHTRTLTRVGGVVLVGVGALQVTGVWSAWIASLQVVVAAWQAPL